MRKAEPSDDRQVAPWLDTAEPNIVPFENVIMISTQPAEFIKDRDISLIKVRIDGCNTYTSFKSSTCTKRGVHRC